MTRPDRPIVFVKDNGNYVIQGRIVDNDAALSTMDIPAHETCVEVSKAQVKALVEERR